jgi:hypothetical protein
MEELSSISEVLLGDRIGVVSGSVRRMSWIATSSSEITEADVGVGVGRGCLLRWSWVVVVRIELGYAFTEAAGVCGNGGINGRL